MAERPLSSEGRITVGAAGLGSATLFVDLIRGQSDLPVAIQITMMCCVTVIIVGYQISRGLAKYEVRGTLPPGARLPEPPLPQPPPEPGAR